MTEQNAEGVRCRKSYRTARERQEISNKESFRGLITEENADGTPVKEVTATD